MNQRGNAIPALLIFVIWLAFVLGWIHNIVVIVGADFSHLTGMLVLRVIGIFVAPIGAVLGYF